MTLYRQLIIAVAALFLLLYGTNAAVGLYHARVLVEQQMEVHAQDTATSVAFAMTQAAKDNDAATLETMFNVVSDSGYFRRITYRGLDGGTHIDRSFPISVESVPDWFIRLFPLPSPEGRAEVASGWMRLGELVVTSHPGQAYQKLWYVARDQLVWFALVTISVCLLAAFSLRILLRPLSRLEQQANAICDKQFVVQEEIPRTRELQRVVEAMNRMASRLKKIYEGQLTLISHWQERASRDSVTGLVNRLGFDMTMKAFMQTGAEPVSGALMIFAIDNFERINERAGRGEGNAVLQHVGEKLTDAISGYPESIIARRQGPEFTVFVPNVIEEDARLLAEKAFVAVSAVEWRDQEEDPLVMHMGFNYESPVTGPGDILVGADMALKQARSTGKSWCSLTDAIGQADMPLLSASSNEWRTLLEQVLANRDITLLYQPIFSSRRKRIGSEVFSRLKSGDHLIAASVFIPLAERFGLAPEFDKLILETLAKQIERFPARHYICVNISTTSVQDEEFRSWLEQFLAREKQLSKRLVVELSEHAMNIEEHHVRELSQVLVAARARLGIDHFGLQSSAFGYLGSLPLHHIKVHRSFVHGLEGNADNRFYIHSLALLAHSRSIKFAVEGIERDEEWDVLVSFDIDAAQGYLLGQPSADPFSS